MTEAEIDYTYAISEIQDLQGEVGQLTTQVNDLTTQLGELRDKVSFMQRLSSLGFRVVAAWMKDNS